jgi:uncharacterized protein (DUF1800 family)
MVDWMANGSALIRHMSDRLGYGPRPGDLDRIAALGVDRWIDQQLHPASIPLPPQLDQRLSQYVTLTLSPPQLFVEYGPQVGLERGAKPTPEEQQERARRLQFVVGEAISARLVRAIESPRQLEELLAEFWFNHFNIFIGKELDRLWTGAYVEEAIRPHLFGRFRDLLGATAKHPAMLIYLDNWLNTAPGSPGARGQFEGLNENYARELMELHTLGVDGGYTQADVIALARILTGWTIGPIAGGRQAQASRATSFFPMMRVFRGGQEARVEGPRALGPRGQGRGVFVFDPDRHDDADKTLLGRLIRARGIEEGEEALDMLARSPATARHISLKLAQFLLADQPDRPVVEAMTKTFLGSDGDITAVLRTLFASAAFRAPASFGTRFKTPYRYVVSAVRAAGISVTNFRPLEGTLNQLGERPYACLTPDGYKTSEEAWLNPDAMMRRVSFAVAFSTGNMRLEQPPDDAMAQAPPTMPRPPGPRGTVVDPAALLKTLGEERFSQGTLATIVGAAPELRSAMLLGAPEFMRF